MEGSSAGPVIDLTRVALGAAGIMLRSAGEALDRLPSQRELACDRGGLKRGLSVVLSALVAVALDAERRSLGFGWAGWKRARPAFSSVTGLSLIRRPLAELDRRVRVWEERGTSEQRENERLVRELLGEILPGLVRVVLDHVDVNDIVSRVDVEKLIDRLDIDSIAARINMNSIIERIDLPRFTQQVMEKVDIRGVVRESTSTITTEGVDALRYRGMSLDIGLSRAVDRILLRDRRRGQEVAGDAGPRR